MKLTLPKNVSNYPSNILTIPEHLGTIRNPEPYNFGMIYIEMNFTSET